MGEMKESSQMSRHRRESYRLVCETIKNYCDIFVMDGKIRRRLSQFFQDADESGNGFKALNSEKVKTSSSNAISNFMRQMKQIYEKIPKEKDETKYKQIRDATEKVLEILVERVKKKMNRDDSPKFPDIDCMLLRKHLLDFNDNILPRLRLIVKDGRTSLDNPQNWSRSNKQKEDNPVEGPETLMQTNTTSNEQVPDSHEGPDSKKPKRDEDEVSTVEMQINETLDLLKSLEPVDGSESSNTTIINQRAADEPEISVQSGQTPHERSKEKGNLREIGPKETIVDFLRRIQSQKVVDF